MRTCLIPVFLLSLLIVSCHSPNLTSRHTAKTLPLLPVTPEPRAYPIWFLNPPTGLNVPTAVGYSQTYLEKEASIEAATQDGLERLATHISVRIRGEVSAIGDYQKQYFQEMVPNSIKQTVTDTHKLLATHVGSKMTVVLLGVGEANAPNPATVTLQSLKHPGWLKEIPREQGYVYGSGHCGKRYYEESGWRTAEADARIHLALNFRSFVHLLVKHLDAQVESTSITETDVGLKQIEVVGRWFDMKTKTYHVLARVPLNQNTDTVISEWNQLDNVPLPSREEILRRAFDELGEKMHQDSQVKP
jgi:hypothetical protein